MFFFFHCSTKNKIGLCMFFTVDLSFFGDHGFLSSFKVEVHWVGPTVITIFLHHHENYRRKKQKAKKHGVTSKIQSSSL